MAVNEDDPVARIVEKAIAAQTRLLLAYMESMRESLKRQLETEVRDEFAGDRPYIGKGANERATTRDAAIRKDCAPASEGGGGLSLRAASRKYHLSKSQVSRVLAKDGTADGG